MQPEQVARLFDRFRREGKGWRARCPVHQSKSLTLGIYPKEDRTIVVCYAGCESDDILAEVGITWKDTLYAQTDPKEWRKAQQEREARELDESDARIHEWIRLFRVDGYTAEDRARDLAAACAVAQIMSVEGDRLNWKHLLATHMERTIAADICRSKRWLPKVARERDWDFPTQAFVDALGKK